MNKNRGFSLIEIIVAVAILGILSAIFVPSLINITKKTKNEKDIVKFTALETVFKKATSEKDVLHEIKGNDNPSVIIYFRINDNGQIKFNDGYIKYADNTTYKQIKTTKLWLNSYQSIGTEYIVENKDYYGEYLIYTLIPPEKYSIVKCSYEIKNTIPE